MDAHSIRLCGRDVERPGHICAFFSSPEEECETLLPYFRDGVRDGEQVLNIVDDALLHERVSALQSSGVPSCLRQNAPGTERAIEYEARMNLLVPKFDCTFMCAYQLEHLSGETVVDIMATHPFVILKGELRENTFYIPPERYLADLLNARTKQ
jgi:hypothetical protein